MRATATLLCALAAFAHASPARGEQCVDFSLANVSSATAAYNPFDPFDAAADLIILARRTDATVSEVRFLLSDRTVGVGGPGLGMGGPADYEIQWLEDASRAVLASHGEEPTARHAVVAAFDGANDMATEDLRLIIPRGQPMAPGTAGEQLDVVFECLSSDGEVVERGLQPSRIRIAARHVPNFSVYISGIGARSGVLDLGVLDVDAPSTTGQLSIAALSSVPYEMTIRSDNDFQLRREESDGAGLIPYTVTVDGVAIEANETLRCPATPPPIGQTLDVAITVPGPLRTHRAGSYRDVIILSFSARDSAGGSPRCVRN